MPPTDPSGAGAIPRRLALVQISALAAAGLSPLSAGAQGVGRDALVAYLDVLLPGLDTLPPASSLGIADRLTALAAPGSPMERLLDAGISILDGLSDRRFADLPPTIQARAVEAFAATAYDEVPGRFHHVVRLLALGLYYEHPATLGGLPLNPAPQPAGYPPPWDTA